MVRLRRTSVAGKSSDLGTGVVKLNVESLSDFTDLFQRFLNPTVPTVSSPKELATLMAHSARTIQGAVLKSLRQEEGSGKLASQVEGFRHVLLVTLMSDNSRICTLRQFVMGCSRPSATAS